MVEELLNQIVFLQAAAISLGILTCQCNDFLQNSRPGLIETIKNELENVSIFKETMDHMDMIIFNFDGGSMNLGDPIIIAAETSHKDNLHLGKAIKADNCEDLMKATEKQIKYLTTEDVW